MARIAMTGSSGLIGTALARRLEGDGHEVLRMVRGSPGDASAVWDPAAGWVREGALAGCDVVVNLGGASIGEGRWTASRKAELRRSRIEATRLLIDHLRTLKPPPRAFVSASAVGYYGDRGDEVLVEESAAGDGFLAELVSDWEHEASRAAEVGCTTALVRLGVVIAGEGGALSRMLLPFRLGVGGRLGNGRQWMSWITLEDAVGGLAHVIDEGLGGPLNVVAPGAVTNREFTAALGRALRRPAFMPVPAVALRMVFGEMAPEMLLASQRVAAGRLVASGYRFSQPEIEGALAAALGKR